MTQETAMEHSTWTREVWELVYTRQFSFHDIGEVVGKEPGAQTYYTDLAKLLGIYFLLVTAIFLLTKVVCSVAWEPFSRKFDPKDRFTWCNSVVSSLVVSPVVTCAYAPAWLKCAWTTEDRLEMTCPWVIRAFVLHAAISLFEIVGYALNRDKNPLKYLHHVCALVFLVAGLGQKQAHFYIYTGGLLEGSNFFLGVYYMQKVLKKHDFLPTGAPGLAEIVNGVALWLAYLTFRILPLAYSGYVFTSDSINHYDVVWTAPHRDRTILVAGCFGFSFLLALSALWFAQISRILLNGVVNALCPKSASALGDETQSQAALPEENESSGDTNGKQKRS